MNLEIEKHFTYHPPHGNQPEMFQVLRNKAKDLAYSIEELCPNSREKSLAMTKLQEVIMWANCSIVINMKKEEE